MMTRPRQEGIGSLFYFLVVIRVMMVAVVVIFVCVV